jgi:hypothetical protein
MRKRIKKNFFERFFFKKPKIGYFEFWLINEQITSILILFDFFTILIINNFYWPSLKKKKYLQADISPKVCFGVLTHRKLPTIQELFFFEFSVHEKKNFSKKHPKKIIQK